MRDTFEGETLPGMEAAMRPLDARPASVDMRDGKTYTAAVLFRDHPQVVQSICLLLFKRGLPVAWIAEALRVSEHTVKAIENYVLEAPQTDAARAAFFVKTAVNKSRRIAHKVAIDALRKRLEERPDSLTVAEILSIAEATEEKEVAQAKKNEDVVDVAFIDSFEDAINGLGGVEKKRAANGAECSTSDANFGVRSFEMSDRHNELKDISLSLCNPLSNADNRAENPAAKHSETGDVAAENVADIGAGGAPGGASRPWST